MAAALASTSCAISLDAAPAGTAVSANPPLAPGCLLFRDANSGVGLLQGAGQSLRLEDGTALWMFSGASLSGGASISGGLKTSVSASGAASCFAGASLASTPVFDPPPQGSDYFVTPLDLVSAGGAIWAWYQLYRFDSTAAFGVRSEGFGIAKQRADGTFATGPNLLWSGDGPSFGESAIVVGDDVYVYGCGPLNGAATACYLARVAGGSIDDLGSYEYSMGSGRFTHDSNAAEPVIDGLSSISVRLHSAGRYFATYLAPLEVTVKIRSALSPSGPFSQEYPLATCQTGAGDFCTGANQHPELESDPSLIAISYAATSFNGTPPGDRYWPRLALVRLPAALP